MSHEKGLLVRWWQASRHSLASLGAVSLVVASLRCLWSAQGQAFAASPRGYVGARRSSLLVPVPCRMQTTDTSGP